jgi:hypothetical protein
LISFLLVTLLTYFPSLWCHKTFGSNKTIHFTAFKFYISVRSISCSSFTICPLEEANRNHSPTPSTKRMNCRVCFARGKRTIRTKHEKYDCQEYHTKERFSYMIQGWSLYTHQADKTKMGLWGRSTSGVCTRFY